MQKNSFSGDEPVVCLRFLVLFRKICDENEVSERDALKIWPYSLTDSARVLFDHMTEDWRSYSGNFSDCPSAVQFFLCTDAKDEYLVEADARWMKMKQIATE